MSKFKIGEIVILINVMNEIFRHQVGTECEIASERYQNNGRVGYDIFIEGDIYPYNSDGRWFTLESNLRKKKPPKEELSTWEEIQKLTNWSPNKERVE